MQEKKIIRSTAESLTRIGKVQSEVTAKLDTTRVSRHVERLTKPKSPGSTMRKAGVALIAAPDPVTGVAGVALVASSLALKKSEPAKLANIVQETKKILKEMQSFRI